MKHTQKQLEAMSDPELSKIIAMMSKYAIPFDINRWANMGMLIDEIANIGYEIITSKDKLMAWRSVQDRFTCYQPLKRASAIVYILIKQGE